MTTVKNLSDLLDEAGSSIRIDLDLCARWGNSAEGCVSPRWCLDPVHLELYFGDPKTGKWNYSVDLERCCSSVAMLDWIFQVNKKRWCTPKIMHDLITALEDIFDPQANICTLGIGGCPSKTANPRVQVKDYLARQKRSKNRGK